MTILIYPGNEHVIEAARWKLAENLPEAIIRVNALVTDDIAIDEIPESRIFDYPPTLNEILDFPAIGIMELPGEWTQDVGDSATANYPFAVVLYVQNPDQRALARQLRRGRQAIVSTLMVDRRLDHPSGDGNLGAWGIKYDGFRPGRTLNAGEGNAPVTYTSWTSMGFTALAEDNPS